MDLTFALISLIILIFSAILHEVAHGWVADRMGDPTARLLGRLTLNPIPHIDPLMSVLLPLILYISTQGAFVLGAAKPVPVDPFNLRDGRKDMAIVSLAGPVTNFLIAVLAALVLKFGADFISSPVLLTIIFRIVELNLLLGIFNLLPIPPLDGSKVFSLLLPENTAKSYLALGSVGFFIIFFLLMVPIGGFSLGELISNLMGIALGILGL